MNEIAVDILIWTCVAVFISTSVITILGLINRVTIRESFQKKLFKQNIKKHRMLKLFKIGFIQVLEKLSPIRFQ